jgi:CRISP-associated protein Cas1
MRRIIDLSGSNASDDGAVFRVRVDKGCLLIAHGVDEDAEEVRVPVTDVAVAILGYRLALSGAVLGAITAHGGSVLSLDDRFRPAGLMLPIAGNGAHADRLRLQIEKLPALAPVLWQQIVRRKILAQAHVLRPLNAVTADRIENMAADVQPGDEANVEATAARMYWPALMGPGFRRDDEANGTNSLLNYGYAVLRSVVARAICAAGLHPTLGIHHRGGRDSFALADDLMEPARPAIDRVVVGYSSQTALDRQSKKTILGALLSEVTINGHQGQLVDAYEFVCASLRAVLDGERTLLELPVLP